MNPYYDNNPKQTLASHGNTPTVTKPVRDHSYANLLRPLEVCVDGIMLIGEYNLIRCIESCESTLLSEECKIPLVGKELLGNIA